ncbi:MAG TPA: hypothetical protein VKU01_13120 [Bryobacteraceae bacterium]|nr:hypothetical protein [Bryobacteraceae bacterium]
MRIVIPAAAFLLSAAALAQTPAISISSAALNINPQATDSYTLTGSFSALRLDGAQSISFALGQFSGTIPISYFVPVPNTNILQYQDQTGLTPYWLSSLTIDQDTQTFTAQASGIVLAGLSNPFSVQFGTDQGAACSMARVQAASDGSFQLTPGDGVSEPCQIPSKPTLQPILARAQSSVTVTIELLPTPGLDPQSLNVFLADTNGQPSGDPLCTLTDNGDGTSSCTALFNPTAPGLIPLLVQANAAGQTILSPGFSLPVVQPGGDADMQQAMAIQGTMSQEWPNFLQYGDSAYARIQTLIALRTLLSPQAGLTGQPVGLAPDGLSIGAQTNSGLMMVMPLNQLHDELPSAAVAQSPPLSAQAVKSRTSGLLPTRPLRPQDNNPPQCGQPQRDIVQNNNVLVWDPGAAFVDSANDPAPAIAGKLAAVKCPAFQITPVSGLNATVSSLDNFPNYGTIIILTHGVVGPDVPVSIETGELGILPALLDPTHYDVACNNYTTSDGKQSLGCFLSVYPSNPHLHALQNTVIFNGMCHGYDAGVYQAFAPGGSSSAYFAFDRNVTSPEDLIAGSAVFESLVNEYSDAVDAWSAGSALIQGLHMWYDQQLAYLGNPVLFSVPASDQPFVVSSGATVSLQAQLAGAQSCDGIMNYHWSNTANDGHLMPANDQTRVDDYFGIESLSIYTAFADLSNATASDQIKVDFAPDLSNPIAAEACATVQPKTSCIAVLGNDQGQSCTLSASADGSPWTLTLTTLPGQPYGTFTITFAKTPGTGGFGIQSPGILSASATISPGGQGTSPTYTMSCTPPFEQSPGCGFVLELTNMMNPSAPHGDVATGGQGPNNGNISLNFVF